MCLAARVVVAVAGLLLGTAEPSQSASQQTPAGDREIRVTRGADGAVTTLTLILRNTQGLLPINLVLSATQAGPRAKKPVEFAMDFHTAPNFGGPLDFDRPHYVLNIDEGSPEHDTVESSVDERQPIFAVNRVSVPFDVVTLSRLTRARTVGGRLFGIRFQLTPEQIRAIGDFGVRSLQP